MAIAGAALTAGNKKRNREARMEGIVTASEAGLAPLSDQKNEKLMADK